MDNGMEMFVYRPGAECIEQISDRKLLADFLADDENVVWVDLRGETPDDIALAEDVLKNDFKFHYLTIEDCIETRNQPKIEGFPDYVYFIVHSVKSDETSPTNFVTKELDGYLGKNFVVTFHREQFTSIVDVKQQVLSSSFACERGAAYLLHQILDKIVDMYMPVVDEVDESISVLEERVLRMKRGSTLILEDIMNLRRSVALMKRISSRQLEVLYRMSHGEFPQIPATTLPFFRDVHDHLLRISDLAENYRDLVGSLFEIHFAVVNNKINDVMKTLAVVSAIILPLTLIAGIYGMNFKNMPELQTDHGYYYTLIAMGVITVVLLVYFWRHGWIFQKNEDLSVSDDTK